MNTFPPEDEDIAIGARKSDVFGEVRLYAPEGEPDTWAEQGFLLMTQHGEWKPVNGVMTAVENIHGAGIRVLVRADRAFECFERTTFLSEADLWVDETAEVFSL